MELNRDLLVDPNTKILDVISVIDSTLSKIAIVVDEGSRILGTVTDGDVRRGILRGIALTDPVNTIMNEKPFVGDLKQTQASLLAIMKEKSIEQIPIVDVENRAVGLVTLRQLVNEKANLDNWVVIMVGGLGSRLAELTKNVPKPMLRVGGKPILETILLSLKKQGFNRFFLAVNHKSEIIEEYFNEGAPWGVTIEYLREKKKLGTAGALSLLPEKPTKPVLVMNGDLLTDVDMNMLLNFHEEHNSTATMCVKQYEFQVPYGVVQTEGAKFISLDEKPKHQFFVNAGIYAINPEALCKVPVDTSFDVPDLFKKLSEENFPTGVFPVREEWIDIGRPNDYLQAQDDWNKKNV